MTRWASGGGGEICPLFTYTPLEFSPTAPNFCSPCCGWPAHVCGASLRDARSLRARPEYQQRETVRSVTAGGRPAREAGRCDSTCSDPRAGVRGDDH